MKKFIYYLTVPFQDISFRIVFIILTVKLFSFTYVNDLGSDSFFPAFGAIMMGLAFSVLISRHALKIAYLLFFDLLCSLIFYSNALHLKYFGDYATFNNLIQVDQLTAVADMIFKMSKREMLYITDLLCAPLLFIWTKEDKNKDLNNKVLVFFIIFMSGVFLNCESLNYFKTHELESIFYRRYYVRKMGIMSYQITDAYYYFIKEKERTLDKRRDLDAVSKWLSGKMHGKTSDNYNELTNIGKGMNLIIIQVESLQNFVINKKYRDGDITPNLNALARKGVYFNNIFDQTGYGNSSDATLLVNTSLHPSRIGAACFLYAQNCFDSLPKVLKDYGYTTATMHANVKQFWNSEVFEKSLGFERQFYKDDYLIVDMLGWGLSDKAFFSQSVDKIKVLQSPFYVFLRTLSSHGPFDQFSSGDADNYPLYELDGKLIGHYLRAMHYADAAIGSFLQSLSENKLLANAIIVIYGDHRAHIPDEDLRYMGVRDINENKKIPLIIVVPGRSQGKGKENFGGLIDVTPTISNILGIDISDRYFLGKDLGDSKNSFAIFRDGSYIPRGGAIDSITAQKELQLSDMILEKDLIPLLSNRGDCH